jgi:hypothetical protein
MGSIATVGISQNGNTREIIFCSAQIRDNETEFDGSCYSLLDLCFWHWTTDAVDIGACARDYFS